MSEIKGTKEMVKKIMEAAVETPLAVGRAIYQEAQIEVTEMKRRCPVDVREDAPHPGNLRNSIHAEEPRHGEGNRIYVLVATGQQAPYGIYVHEDPDAHHVVGEWKFMEGPLKESAPYMAARVAARIDLNKKKSMAEE